MAGKLDQAAGGEILVTSGGSSVEGRPFWKREVWLETIWVLGVPGRGQIGMTKRWTVGWTKRGTDENESRSGV